MGAGAVRSARGIGTARRSRREPWEAARRRRYESCEGHAGETEHPRREPGESAYEGCGRNEGDERPGSAAERRMPLGEFDRAVSDRAAQRQEQRQPAVLLRRRAVATVRSERRREKRHERREPERHPKRRQQSGCMGCARGVFRAEANHVRQDGDEDGERNRKPQPA